MSKKLLLEIIDDKFYDKLKADQSQKFTILEDFEEVSELKETQQLELIYNAFKSIKKSGISNDVLVAYIADKTKLGKGTIRKVLTSILNFEGEIKHE